MSPSYGYGEAHPYWTMHPVQEVSEPYCYTERYWPSPAYPRKYWEGRSYEGSYPEWEEYQYGPNVNCAPPRYRGYRSPAYSYPPPPPPAPPRAFTYAHRPFHPSDQFRHPDEYPMRFVPVPLGYDYESFSPRMRAVKQEPLREMPNDKHCCGCPNHVCHSEGNASNPKQIQANQDADGNSDGDIAKHQLQEYPFPVVWFPYGHWQFPRDFNSNKSSEDDQKQITDKSVQDGKLRPASFFLMPPGLTLCKDNGNETAKVQTSDGEKKNPNENICRSKSAEELGKEMPKARDIPVKQISEATPSNEGISESVSAEELRKELPRVKEIPVMQAVEEKRAEQRKETKSSSPRAPRLPPVCLRIDPLHKKADGKSSSRSPSPPHTGSAAGTSKERVKKCDENAQSNASQVSEETNTQKIEQQSNVQANKASEGGGYSSKKTHTMTAEAAATIIQSFYRGYQVRRLQPLRKLREISKIRGRVNELIEQVSNRELFVGLSRDVKAKERFSETLMGLLLQLDTIQGLHPVVRDMRKSVATEIVALQEKLDQLSIDCPQQIPFAAEETELQNHAPEVSALNNCSGHLQDERELVVDDDKNLAKTQEASSSSDTAGKELPEEAPKQKEMVLSSTVEQTTQTADDAVDIFSTPERDDSTNAEHENEETIQAADGALDPVTAEKGAYSAEVNVADRGNDSAEVKVEGEHENKHYDSAEVNVAGGGNNSVEIKVEAEHENKHYDSAEVKVEAEHENKFQIQSLGGALDSDVVEEGSESVEAEAKVEVENENKHTVQAEEEGNTSMKQEAETKSENNDEKSSVAEMASVDGKSSVSISEEDSVEVNEIKNTLEKTEEIGLAAEASISVEEEPIKCSASSAVVEEKPIECFPLKAGETFNPPVNIAFQSDELLTPATEFESNGEELVPKCDEASNSFAQDKEFFDALNPSTQPCSNGTESHHVTDKHAIETETSEGSEHCVVEPQGKPECQDKSDHNEEAHEVKCKEDWEAENKRLKETVEKLLEAAKYQASTIAELDKKLKHLESKLSNGSRRSSRAGSMKLQKKNNVFLRRNDTPPTP